MPSYKDKNNGKWFCKFYYTNWNGEKKQKKKSGFNLKKEADQWERTFLEKYKAQPHITIETMWGHYLESIQGDKKILTLRNKKTVYNSKIKPWFKNLYVDEITPFQIKKWQLWLQKQNISNSTINAYKMILSSLFTFAVKYFGLSKNPCSAVSNLKVIKKEMDYWTLEEFNEYMNNVQTNDTLKLMVYILFWTGMRIGELLALQIKDINFKDNTITISKNAVYMSSENIIIQDTTKNYIKRDINIHNALKKRLNKHIDGLYGAKEDTLLFPMSNYHYVKRHFRNSFKKVNVKKIRIHDLRHSHISLLINLGYPINGIARRVGDTPETIISTYAHIYKKTTLEFINKLETLDTNRM